MSGLKPNIKTPETDEIWKDTVNVYPIRFTKLLEKMRELETQRDKAREAAFFACNRLQALCADENLNLGTLMVLEQMMGENTDIFPNFEPRTTEDQIFELQ